jgi:hypothetical protein
MIKGREGKRGEGKERRQGKEGKEGRGGEQRKGWDGVNPLPRKQILATALYETYNAVLVLHSRIFWFHQTDQKNQTTNSGRTDKNFKLLK